MLLGSCWACAAALAELDRRRAGPPQSCHELLKAGHCCCVTSRLRHCRRPAAALRLWPLLPLLVPPLLWPTGSTLFATTLLPRALLMRFLGCLATGRGDTTRGVGTPAPGPRTTVISSGDLPALDAGLTSVEEAIAALMAAALGCKRMVHIC